MALDGVLPFWQLFPGLGSGNSTDIDIDIDNSTGSLNKRESIEGMTDYQLTKCLRGQFDY